jgi:hypothetical protein
VGPLPLLAGRDLSHGGRDRRAAPGDAAGAESGAEGEGAARHQGRRRRAAPALVDLAQLLRMLPLQW